MENNQYARAGRVMFILVWIIVFVGLFLFFSYYEKTNKPVFNSNHSEMTLSPDRDGHYRVKGKINNIAVVFLIDTGATSVAIPQQLAERMHLVGRYPITIVTANGEVTGSLTRVDELSFGEFILRDVKAVIIPSRRDDEVLLGMNVLAQFNITQQDRRLILKKQ